MVARSSYSADDHVLPMFLHFFSRQTLIDRTATIAVVQGRATIRPGTDKFIASILVPNWPWTYIAEVFDFYELRFVPNVSLYFLLSLSVAIFIPRTNIIVYNKLSFWKYIQFLATHKANFWVLNYIDNRNLQLNPSLLKNKQIKRYSFIYGPTTWREIEQKRSLRLCQQSLTAKTLEQHPAKSTHNFRSIDDRNNHQTAVTTRTHTLGRINPLARVNTNGQKIVIICPPPRHNIFHYQFRTLFLTKSQAK